MSPIRVLERSVAERIAAGEVVERPASVVKELVENSLDAGARTVTVEAIGAGLTMIRVTDDGEGIAASEAALAFERFATSKIGDLDDLDRIRTYGFRGEALPSIAAVAQVVLTTRPAGAEAATRVVVAGGVVESAGRHGAPPGTVVEVRALFYNTPARRRFLKSPAREQALVVEAVQRAALAHPDVAFRLVLDGREATYWPRATAAHRAADLLAAGDDLIAVDGAVPGGRLRGWLARPERSRPARTAQHLFVNRRPVQHAMLRRAVEQAFAQLVPVGRFPVFALFLDVDPARVDVNVHPRKLEVRFRDEGTLFGPVTRLVRGALLASPLVRDAGGSDAVAVGLSVAGAWTASTPAAASIAREPSEVYAPGARGTVSGAQGTLAGTVPDTVSGPRPRLPVLRPLGQVLQAYIVAEGPDGLYLIDQHAAHERVVYERLVAARRRGAPVSQTLAVPLALDLTPAEAALAVGQLDRLAALGFDLEPFGGRTVLVRAVPVAGANGAPETLVRRALASLEGGGDPDQVLERLAIATACHTAVRAGDRLGAEAIAALLADLAAAEDPYTCFHGRPTIVAVPRHLIERWFLRT